MFLYAFFYKKIVKMLVRSALQMEHVTMFSNQLEMMFKEKKNDVLRKGKKRKRKKKCYLYARSIQLT